MRAPVLAAVAMITFLVYRSEPVCAQPETALPAVSVESIEFSDIGPDSMEAILRVSARVTRSATVRGLVFASAAVNGVTVHVAPVTGPIHFRAGQPAFELPNLRITLAYRELDSLQPLRRAVQDGKAQIRAEVHGQLELDLFHKLALRTGGAWMTMKLDQQIPVSVPGGQIGRITAAGVLAAAEPVWIAGRREEERRRGRSDLAQRVRSMAAGRIVLLGTRYEVRSADGETAEMRVSRLGFLTGGGEVLAPMETIEPWIFDSSLAQALARGEASIDESKREILVTLCRDSRTFSLQRGEIRIAKTIHKAETAVDATSGRRYHIRFRDSESNAVLLDIPALKDAAAGAMEPAQIVDSGDWEQAAVVRFDRNDPHAEPQVWLTQARMEEGRFRIKDLVDSATIGSPLWLDGGLAGMLQDEGSAVDIKRVLKRLQ